MTVAQASTCRGNDLTPDDEYVWLEEEDEE